MVNINTTSNKAIAAANQKGVAALNQGKIVGSDNFPPMYGPKINPKPKAAPISPKFFALFSGFVTSAIAACATDTFPPVTPSKIREKNKSGKFFVRSATANNTYERTVPAKE